MMCIPSISGGLFTCGDIFTQ